MCLLRWLILMLSLFADLILACPHGCSCKWKGGKQTVDCSNKSMTDIPYKIDSGTQVLDFSGNNLNRLSSDRFQKIGLVNLQKIFLSRCEISHIDDRAFRALLNLVDLDLSQNSLSAVPSNTFRDYPSLMKLVLNGNPLRVIKSSAFYSLQQLVSLELSKCQLHSIEKNAFAGLISLEWLKLDNNYLKYVPGPSTLPKGLHGVALEHNPWFCDCFLMDMFIWLNGATIPEASEPKCSGPYRLRGAPIKFLDENELACLPEVTPTSLYLEISEGKNVSLLCKVHGIPEAKVSWWFHGRILQNNSIVAPGVHLYYYLEEGTVNKKSELFIFNTNIENNGTYICMAENQAGRTQSNYTIRIVLKEEPIAERKTMPIEDIVIVVVLTAVSLILIASISYVSCLLKYKVRRRRRIKKEKTKELALYGNHRSADGGSSTITRAETEFLENSAKFNGGLEVKQQQQQQQHIPEQTSTLLTYPSYSVVSAPLDQNPDLISDAEKDRSNSQSGDEMSATGISTVSTLEDRIASESGPSLMNNVADCIPDNKRYKPAVAAAALPISQCQETHIGWISAAGGGDGTGTNNNSSAAPLIVCINHLQSSASPNYYPPDYGYPKMAHFPPIMPATAFYRTLPHKRQNPTQAGNLRYAREAEFLQRSSTQPASYEHYRSDDVRYNVEGYPMEDSFCSHYSPHVTFSDTIHIIERPMDRNVCRGTQVENAAAISLINASAQTISDQHSPSATSQTTTELTNDKLRITNATHPRPQGRSAAIADSPDEGYVGECNE